MISAHVSDPLRYARRRGVLWAARGRARKGLVTEQRGLSVDGLGFGLSDSASRLFTAVSLLPSPRRLVLVALVSLFVG